MKQAAAQAQNFSMLVDGDRHHPVLVAFLRGEKEMLAPILLPLYRTAKLHRCGGNDRFLTVEWRLGPEAAPHLRRNHPDRFEIAFQQVGKRAATQMWRLGRRPDRHSSPARL